MFVLHALWTRDALHFWAEEADRAAELFADQASLRPAEEDEDAVGTVEAVETTVATETTVAHCYALTSDELLRQLVEGGILTPEDVLEAGETGLMLPHRRVHGELIPEPGERLASRLRWSLDSEGLQLQSFGIEGPAQSGGKSLAGFGNQFAVDPAVGEHQPGLARFQHVLGSEDAALDQLTQQFVRGQCVAVCDGGFRGDRGLDRLDRPDCVLVLLGGAQRRLVREQLGRPVRLLRPEVKRVAGPEGMKNEHGTQTPGDRAPGA